MQFQSLTLKMIGTNANDLDNQRLGQPQKTKFAPCRSYFLTHCGTCTKIAVSFHSMQWLKVFHAVYRWNSNGFMRAETH